MGIGGAGLGRMVVRHPAVLGYSVDRKLRPALAAVQVPARSTRPCRTTARARVV